MKGVWMIERGLRARGKESDAREIREKFSLRNIETTAVPSDWNSTAQPNSSTQISLVRPLSVAIKPTPYTECRGEDVENERCISARVPTGE